jgi:hypothetical protein
VLILAGVHTKRDDRGRILPAPMEGTRAQRLLGFAAHKPVRDSITKLASLEGIADHTPGRPGTAQTVMLRPTLFAPLDAYERKIARQLGGTEYLTYPASWFYRGYIAALPAASRYVFLFLRAFEPVMDEDAWLAKAAELRGGVGEAYKELLRLRSLMGASMRTWARRAGMSPVAFEEAISDLTHPVLDGAAGYIEQLSGSAKHAPCSFKTNQLHEFTPPLSFEQLNASFTEVDEHRAAVFPAARVRSRRTK